MATFTITSSSKKSTDNEDRPRPIVGATPSPFTLSDTKRETISSTPSFSQEVILKELQSLVASQSTPSVAPKDIEVTSPAPAEKPAVVSDTERETTSKVYAGDRVDTEGPITKSGQWETIQFESAFELIYTVDRHLNEGHVHLHKWQIEILEELSSAKPSSQKPYRLALCAANGSGKDLYVIAPFVVFFALTRIRALTVITSSSGVQLTAQTENYIAALCHSINALYGERIFKVTKRFIKCLKSGSEIRMFATDEAGKAEGYHPLEPGAEMMIVVNEAKSVAPEIFGALSRCTGYNFWLNVSTPGEPFGDFYDSFTNWSRSKRVTAFHCPHLSEDHISEMRRKYGETSAIYRSQILALFTQIGGQVVISQDFLNRCIQLSKNKVILPTKAERNKVGIDLAAGGDECSFTVVNGNQILEGEHFIESDTTITEERAEKFIRRYGARSIKLDNPDGLSASEFKFGNCDIFADDGGLGHAIIDRLVRKGYQINRVLNQSRAFDHKQFGNRGAEMWFNVARLIEEKVLYIPLDHSTKDSPGEKLYNQLCYRHFKKTETQGRITLESKAEAKANGHLSPDRADSLVLALSDTDIDTAFKLMKPVEVKERGFTGDELRAQKFTQLRNAVMGLGAGSKEPIKGNSLEELFHKKGLVNN